MQKKVIPLFNIFSNRLYNFDNSFKKDNIISHCQNRNVMSFELLAIKKNSIINLIKINENTLKRNRDVGHFEIKKKIKSINKVTFDVSFLYWEIIIYN